MEQRRFQTSWILGRGMATGSSATSPTVCTVRSVADGWALGDNTTEGSACLEGVCADHVPSMTEGGQCYHTLFWQVAKSSGSRFSLVIGATDSGTAASGSPPTLLHARSGTLLPVPWPQQAAKPGLLSSQTAHC